MIKKFFTKKSNQKLLLFIGLTVVMSFLFAHSAHASLGDFVAQLLCWIIYGIIWCLGQLLTLVMWVLITLAQYNNFINGRPIVFGWGIVRDVCNMFFILILLIIAFGTILRIPQYNMKTLLPKLVMMAILINFSKLICGVIIDFAQVIMLTFVNGFKDVGQGNLFNMLGINDIVNMENTTKGSADVSSWSILGTYILALIFVIVSLVTIMSMVSMLAMRIIMMWVYVVLSPIAYLLSAFPQGQSYASQWWSRFSKNVIVGPVLAFFVWLAFASLGGVDPPQDVTDIMNSNKNASASSTVSGLSSGTGIASTTGPSVGLSSAGSTDHMIKFIISIAMLIGGLQIAQEIGGEAGAAAGKGISRLQSLKAGALKTGKRLASGAGKRLASGAIGATGAIAKGAGKLMGGESTMAGRAAKSLGAVGTGWRQDMVASRKKRAVESRQKFFEKIGMGEKAGAAGAAFTGAVKNRLNVGEQLGKRSERKKNERIEEGGKMIEEGKNQVAEGNREKEMFDSGESDNLMKEGLWQQDIGGKEVEEANKGLEEKQARLNELNIKPKTGDAAADKAVEDETKEVEDAISKLMVQKNDGQEWIKEGAAKYQQGKSINDDARNGFAGANGKIAEGTAKQEKGKAMQEKGSFLNGTAFGKQIKSALNIGDTVTGTTNKAFKKMSEEGQNAKTFANGMKTDGSFLRDASISEFSGASSMNSQQKKNFKAIADDPEASKALLNQLKNWQSSGESPEKFINIARAISKATSGHEKGGESMKNLAPLKSYLTQLAGTIGDPSKLKPSSGYTIAYSDRGNQRIEGQGGFNADRFNKNAEATGNKDAHDNEIHIDFADLKGLKSFGGEDFKDTANAANLDGNQIKEFASYLEGKLNAMKPSDNGYQGLQAAVNNLKNNKPEKLSIKNTGITRGFKEKLSDTYHEDLHKSGVVDESLTRGLEDLMMNMRLTGANKDTGEHHSLEIGQLAAAMEKSGSSHADILKQMEGEIAQRGGSRAFLEPAPAVNVKAVLSGQTGANTGQPSVVNNITNITNINNAAGNAGGGNKKGESGEDRVISELAQNVNAVAGNINDVKAGLGDVKGAVGAVKEGQKKIARAVKKDVFAPKPPK